MELMVVYNSNDDFLETEKACERSENISYCSTESVIFLFYA